MTRSLRSRAPWIALGAILALAAALRLVGIRYGLPLPVLNPDEANIVPRAWRMGHGHLDPGWYDYPSLLMALLAPVQAVFGEARLRGCTVRGRRDRARRRRGDVVARPAGLRDGRGDRRRRDGRGRDDTRRVLANGRDRRAPRPRDDVRARARRRTGASSGPGSRSVSPPPRSTRVRSPLVPVVVAGWGRWRCARHAAALLAVAGFALTSPFVLIHGGRAWDDVSRVQRLARDGWLGFEHDPSTPFAYVDRLWDAVGPFLLVALAGLVAALGAAERAPTSCSSPSPSPTGSR